MACFTVLGSHGGGTSLVASLLDALGVEMHYNPSARIKDYLNYEDTDMTRVNMNILHSAGGNWRSPPFRENILSLRNDEELTKRIKTLVKEKSDADPWGWKDPRSAITIPIWHPHLPDPHYIVVRRDVNKVVRSLMSRGRKSRHPPGFWRNLVWEHYDRIDDFLLEYQPPRLNVTYEDLVDRDRVEATVGLIARFVEAEPSNTPEAIKRIKFQ